ncbi:MAG TPA: YdcF family protein [Mucilaginibacter sp.]|jgi:uncharacterized SAM-binding protein YcdF (DUF218 family)|nr:YdcF family protein [Mucilaginibacter sp.]
MFFIFSKLLVIFIYPFTWILALLFVAILVKKPILKRRFLIAAAALSLIFSNPFLLDQFAKRWDIAPVPLKNSGAYSCVIVLGGFAGEDNNGNGFFNTNADRFIQGLKLVITGQSSHILVSGGNGGLIHDKFEEADWVQTQLKVFKVPDSCVLIEDKSRNTLENAAFSKTILEARHLPPPYLLVTSAFHMRRSLGIFKKAKLDVIPYPCNYMAGNGKTSPDSFIPKADALWTWNFYIKEVIGTLVNYFK